MKRILFCGGRDYNDRPAAFAVFGSLLREHGRFIVVQGHAGGADRLAFEFGINECLPTLSVPANWKQYGRSAGPKRNAFMLSLARPDIVVAFPGGKGTQNMISTARRRGYHVMEFA